MNTANQTKQYDRGYEDAVEGRTERERGHWYLRGYRAGLTIRAEERPGPPYDAAYVQNRRVR
jgi:hypothetical protein